MLFGNVMTAVTRRLKGSAAAPMPTGETARYLELLTNPEGFTPPKANAAKLLALYKSSPWVRAIVGKVAASVARHPFYLEDAAGERIDAHPFLAFLRAGSPRLRGRTAMKITQAHLDLAGEAYWAIGRNGTRPVQYAPIPPNWVTDIPRPGRPFYEIQPQSGVRFTLGETDVLAFRDPDPFDPYERGTGVTEAAWTEIQTDEAAAEFLYSFFKNRARPDIIVSGTKERPLGEKDVPRLETTWLEKFRGVKRSHRPMFSAHPLEVKEIGKGLRDNEVTSIRELQKGIITEVFGIPPEILGRLENSNRATIESADFLFGKHTLEPRLSFLAETLEAFALAEFDIGDLLVKYESPVPDDLTRRLAVMTAFPGKFTGNEVRAVAGLRPRPEPDFDLPTPPVDEAPDSGDDDELDDEPDPEPPKGGKASKSAPAVVTRTLSPDGIVRVAEAHEDPSVRAEVSRIFDEIFGKLVMRYGSELLETLSVDVRFESTVRVANWLADTVPELLGQIDATTRKELAAALVEGAARSERLDDLLKRVDDVFADAAKTRAPLIGDTMATKITGFASQDAAEQAGFERKMWLTSQDQVVRSSHRSMNRQVVPTKSKFQSPRGGRALHPGAFGEASEDARCRCAMRPVLEGETVENSADAAEAFTSMHDKEWSGIASAITERARDVFAGQAEIGRAHV